MEVDAWKKPASREKVRKTSSHVIAADMKEAIAGGKRGAFQFDKKRQF